MTTHVNGQAAALTAAPTLHLGPYRRAIMAVLTAECFTPAERVLANHNVYECEDAARLALWLKNVRRVATEREEAGTAQSLANLAHGIECFEVRLASATAAQTSEIHKLALHRVIADAERTKALLVLPRLTKPQATLLLGELWAKILHRTGGAAHADAAASYSSAA